MTEDILYYAYGGTTQAHSSSDHLTHALSMALSSLVILTFLHNMVPPCAPSSKNLGGTCPRGPLASSTNAFPKKSPPFKNPRSAPGTWCEWPAKNRPSTTGMHEEICRALIKRFQIIMMLITNCGHFTVATSLVPRLSKRRGRKGEPGAHCLRMCQKFPDICIRSVFYRVPYVSKSVICSRYNYKSHTRYIYPTCTPDIIIIPHSR